MSIFYNDRSEKYNHLKEYSTSVITTFTDNGSGGTTVTADIGNTQEGDLRNINTTTNYNGTYKVFNVVAGVSFDIDVAYVNDPADDGVGRWGGSILTPTQTKILGKTTTELGLVNRSTVTDIEDFYTSNNKSDGALKFNGTNQFVSIPQIDMPEIQTNVPFTIVLEFTKPSSLNFVPIFGGNIDSITPNSSFLIRYDGESASDATAWWFRDGSGNRKGKVISNDSIRDNSLNTIIVSFDAVDMDDPSSYKLAINNDFSSVDFQSGGTVSGTHSLDFAIGRDGFPASSGNRFDGTVSVLEVYNFAMTDLEMQARFRDLRPSTPNHIFLFNELENKTSIVSQNGGATATLNNFTGDGQLLGGGIWLNSKSLVPPLVEYSPFNNTIDFEGAFPAISGDFSRLITFRIANNSTTSRILLGLFDTSITAQGATISNSLETSGGLRARLRFGRGGATGPSILYSYNEFGNEDFTLNDDTWFTIVINDTNTSGDVYDSEIFINGNSFINSGSGGSGYQMSLVTKLLIEGQCDIAQAGVFQEHFTAKEVADMGQLGLPPKRVLDTALGYYQFQSGSIFDDGVATEPVIRDLSGNDNHLEVLGLTGGTKADKITDYRNNFIQTI